MPISWKPALGTAVATGFLAGCLVAAFVPGCGARMVPPARDGRLPAPAGTAPTLSIAPTTARSAATPTAGPRSIPTVPADQVMQWPQPAAEAEYHEVRPGETLSSIARQYRTTASRLQSLNGLRSSDLIQPGQMLFVPDASEPERASP